MGEELHSGVGFAKGQSVGDQDESEDPITVMEPQLTEKVEPAEDIDRGETKPLPTAQQRRFSVDWDPIQ